ncbi:hypothetical protein BH10ACI4_BH10ACI4_03410 [soil metagenome]
MTKHMQATLAAMLLLSPAILPAQTSSTPRAKKTGTRKTANHPETAIEAQIRELREQMLSQQAQIDALKQQLADKDAKLATASQDAQAANATAAAATAQTQSVSSSVQANAEAVSTLNSTVADMKGVNAGLMETVMENKKELTEKIESPTTLHYKGVAITPVAFFAFENVYRTRSMNSDINTPFNATPFPGAAEAHTSELNFSGRQSRLGGLFEGNVGKFKLSGYIETDFLSAGATSNENQSNSYTLRQRQFFGQVSTQSGFTLTGGQTWSLVTETKRSTDARTENLPMTVDPQYHVGFSWTRQPGVRVQQKFGNGLTVAASLEEGQDLFSATNQNSNFFFGSAGSGAGLLNPNANYTNNVAPDVIVKAAFDGKTSHFELGGIARFFRDRYYPSVQGGSGTAAGTGTASTAKNDTKVGGGVFGNARFAVTPYLDLGLHGMAGSGVGRYGTSTLPDTTVHPDGTLAPIKSYQGLFSAEGHPTKKLDVFGYAGAEYAQRTVYLNTIVGSANFGKLTGYAPPTSSNAGCNTETIPTGNTGYLPGVPANCLGATRVVIEGTGGFVYRFYNNPRFGRLQYTVQYSYLERGAWAGTGSATGSVAAPKATNNMVFTGLRYYIP